MKILNEMHQQIQTVIRNQEKIMKHLSTMDEIEIWKDIRMHYEVSNLGNFRHKVYKSTHKGGTATIAWNGESKVYSIAYLVAVAFLKNPNNKKRRSR